MEMTRVTTKQTHQKDVDQLPGAPLQMPMSATREKDMQVEKICGRRRNRHVMSKSARYRVAPELDMVS